MAFSRSLSIQFFLIQCGGYGTNTSLFLCRNLPSLYVDEAAEKKKDSSYSKAASLTSLKATSTRVPQAPFLSSATSRANRLIDSTLADPSNPVTHNDSLS
ncbi:hypothetical protein PGT21_000666 [Puccinia graminis f. sp. tritici]|uniref:Uncharacterized protein n=1 Tax=Puccinia graminis f. sp. tritici TaxID=56615 RepID=A0A5B0Q182_PUCGR|nr:hypothetical protein PGT21_000666 [Puccinia graminis f. sp. tritici]